MHSIGREYWRNRLEHPYSPNSRDITTFEQHMLPGSSLLLGCTHDLIVLTDKQLDVDPWYTAATVIKGDWRTNKTFYNNIIGDGVLNLSEQLAHDVVHMSSTTCNRLIVRSFKRRLPKMKVAQYFPDLADFQIKPKLVPYDHDYCFYIWQFGTNE